METITITEALADIKTIGKRVAKKQEFVGSYLARVEAAKDPHAAHGGSAKVIDSERQSISDLWRRVVTIRTAIAASWISSPASGATIWQPSTRRVALLTTSFIITRSCRPANSVFIGRKAVA